MTFNFEDQSPAEYLDDLIASVAKVTAAFQPGGMPQAMMDVAWEILLDELRELRRAQQVLRSNPE